MIQKVNTFFARVPEPVRALAMSLPTLLARVVIAAVFVTSGWGKLQHLDKVVEYFTALGIPAAAVQAPFVAGLELVCGLLVLLGLATRMAVIPLIGTMIVALLTAKRADITNVWSLLNMSEFLYVVVLALLFSSGAGALSVDARCSQRCGSKNG